MIALPIARPIAAAIATALFSQNSGAYSGPSLRLGFSENTYLMGAIGKPPSAYEFDSLITFTRASGGGITNAAGEFEWVGNDVPRITYDPVTLQPRGLLIEEQRTNLLLRSQGFQLGSWGVSTANIARTGSTDTAPDGTLTAATISDTGVGDDFISQSTSVVNDGSTHTFSLYFKKSTGDANFKSVAVLLGGGTAKFHFMTVDTNTGTLSYQAGQTQAGTIQDAGDYWRVALSITNNSTGNTVLTSRIYPAYNLTGSNAPRENAATGSCVIWGAQLEAAATHSSYIPTAASQVTRAADVATVNTLSPWYNSAAGTFVIRHDAPAGRPLLSSDGVALAVSQGPGKLVLAYDAQGSYVSYNDSAYVSGPVLSIGTTLGLFRSASSYMGARGQSVIYFPRKLEVSEGV